MSKSKFLHKIKDDKGKSLKIKRVLMGIVPVQGGVQLKESKNYYIHDQAGQNSYSGGREGYDEKFSLRTISFKSRKFVLS